MPLRVEDATGRFEIVISGDVDEDEAREFVQLMAREALERKTDRALVTIEHGSTLPGNMVRHKMGLLAAKAWPKGLRVAIAGPGDLITHMFEATARIRGVNILVFDDVADAEQWLWAGGG